MRDSFAYTRAFISAEYEGLVLSYRSAEASAELVSLEGGHILKVEEIAGIECGVAQEFKSRAVYLIGSRLGDYVDYPASGAAVLRAVVVRQSLELLYGINTSEAARD